MKRTQKSFADLEYEKRKRKTRREQFLDRMEVLIPLEKLLEKITAHDPTTIRGRPPHPLVSMLSMHCIQLFYNLSDPSMENILYEVESVQRFCGIRLEKVTDETTILNFRPLLVYHELGKNLFKTIKEHLAGDSLLLKTGTILR